MKNNPTTSATDDASSFPAPFGPGQIKIAETTRDITPYAGLASFLAWLGKIGFAKAVASHLPFSYASPNAIALPHTLLAFLVTVLLGGGRFAHCSSLRFDRALHTLMGIPRFPGQDAMRRFFRAFDQPRIEAFWRPLWAWLMTHLAPVPGGFSLDLDSTVFTREGRQQGAAKGYHPRRPGRLSHHPLLAVLAENAFVLHAWLRPGNTTAGRGVVEFLKETLAQLPATWKIRTLRADSGFFDQRLLTHLEGLGLNYVISARLTPQVKSGLRSCVTWTRLDDDRDVGEFTAHLLGWDKPRRFVMIRTRIRENTRKAGRLLLDVPGHSYSVFVTNRTEDPATLWRDYNGRCTVEQRIEELKNDLHADGFCTDKFYATESAFLGVLFAYNLQNAYHRRACPQAGHRKPSTIRSEILVAGGLVTMLGETVMLRIARGWGGLKKHKPLLERVLNFENPTAPLLPQPEPSG